MVIEPPFAELLEQGAGLLAAVLEPGFFALPAAMNLVDHQEGVAPNLDAGSFGVGASRAQPFEDGFEGRKQGVVFGFVIGALIAKAQPHHLLLFTGPTQGITAVALAGIAPTAAIKDNADRLFGRLAREGLH